MSICRQIPVSELKLNSWYVGRGRNGNVGRWDGECFDVIADCLVYNGSFRTPQKTKPGLKFEPYFTADEGCFQPFLHIKPPKDNLEPSPIIIAIEKLQIGRFYICQSEDLNIGRWEGDHFSLIEYPSPSSEVPYPDIRFEKHEAHGGKFAPHQLIDEGNRVEPYMEDGEPHEHYAQLIEFSSLS